MATAPTPCASIRASRPWRSGASGVVRGNGSGTPFTRTPVVPITPGRSPAASKIDSIRYVKVVFPFVPVTPTIAMRSAGCP